MTFSPKKIIFILSIISIAVFAGALFLNTLHQSFFLKLLYDDAKEFAESGIISSSFMPIGYSGFLGTCMKVGGEGSIPACQSVLYAGILFAAFVFLFLCGARGVWLLFGTLAAGLHPVVLVNIWRVHDGNLTILLLLGFLASGFWFFRSKSVWAALLFGAITGLMLTARVNTILLILPALFLLRKKAIMFLAGAAVLFMAVNMAVKQTPFFFPGHGYYNLFSGANEYSAKYLLKDFSGENSHAEALGARGYNDVETFEARLNFPPETYKKLAIEYIKKNPLEYAKLAGIKLFTLFRPGYHAPENFEWFSADGVKRFSKIVLAAPFFVWLFFVWKTRKKFFEKENLFVFLVATLYLLPFVVANADPRYRFPMDIVFILDAYRRVFLHRIRY